MDTINTSIDTNSVDKKKKTFLPKLFIFMTSVLSIIGVGASLLIKDRYVSARAVSYDDENYTIVLNTNEVNNYHFDNLVTLFTSYNLTDSSSLLNGNLFSSSIDGVNYARTFQNRISEYGICYYDDNKVAFIVNATLWNSDLESGILFNDYELCFFSTESYLNTYLYLKVVEGYGVHSISDLFGLLKQAIEQDIASNQPYDNNTFLQDIIELLVGGIGATASGIGNGLSVLVSNIAIQNGTMSPFMALLLIFGGLALALGLSRWVVNLIGSLGQRNR